MDPITPRKESRIPLTLLNFLPKSLSYTEAWKHPSGRNAWFVLQDAACEICSISLLR